MLGGKFASLLPPLEAFSVTTDETDVSPNFSVTKTGIKVGDRVLIEYRAGSTGDFQTYINRTLVGGDISGSVVTLTGATNLADDTAYEFRASWYRRSWGSTGSVIDHTIGSLSPTPLVADQEIFFGALTLTSAGGTIPVNTGADITSASIDSGNGAGHWQIAADGTITPTAAGNTADLSGSPYTLGCTFGNASGSDTATITITAQANTFHVIPDVAGTELKAAIAAITNGPKTIKVRPGVGGGTLISVTGYGSGTGTRPTWTDYVTITSDDSGNPSTLHRLDFIGVNYIKLDNLIGGIARDDAGSPSQTTACWKFRTTDTWPDLDRIQVVNCHLECDPLDGTNTLGGLSITDGTNITVQDNTLDGVHIGVIISNCDTSTVKGNTITRWSGDAFRYSASAYSVTPGSGLYRCSNHDFLFNTGTAPLTDNDPDTHQDFLQIGSSTGEVHYTNFNIIGNVLDDLLLGCQFIFIDDIAYRGNYRLQNAVIAGNVARTTSGHGISVHDGDGVICYNNTVVNPVPVSSPDSAIGARHDGSYPLTSFNTDCDFKYNVCNFQLSVLAGDTNVTYSDNVIVDVDAEYDAAFDDPDHATILTALSMKSPGTLDQAVNIGAVGTGYVDYVAQTYSFPWA